MKPFVLAAVFARGGSKGIVRKNIKLFNGKPLIAYAVETAKALKGVDAVIVSTEDEEIAATAKAAGAEVPFMRPARLAGDDSPELLSWRHAIDEYSALKKVKVDVLVSVPATSPLREPGDVQRCLDELLKSDADAVIAVTPSGRNPYFNMVKIDEAGFATLAAGAAQLAGGRQAFPQVYDITTVAYAVRADFIRRGQALLTGKVKTVQVPAQRALDIDTPLDFDIAEFLFKRKAGL